MNRDELIAKLQELPQGEVLISTEEYGDVAIEDVREETDDDGVTYIVIE